MEDDQEETRVEARALPPMTPRRVDPADDEEDEAGGDEEKGEGEEEANGHAEEAEEETVATPKPVEEEEEEEEKAPPAPKAKPRRKETDDTVVLAEPKAKAKAKAKPASPKTPVKAKPAAAAKAPGAPRKVYVAKRHLRKDDQKLSVLVGKCLRTAQIKRILHAAGITTFTAEAIREARKVVFAVVTDLVHGSVLVSKAGSRVVVKATDVDMAVGYKLGTYARLYACQDMPKPRKRKTVNADGTPRLPPRRKPKAEGENAGPPNKRVKSAPKLAKTSAPSGTTKKRPMARPRTSHGASAAREEPVSDSLAALPVAADE